MTDGAYWLTLFDTSGIQEYVFGANRLKENVGASFLVGEALDGWLHAACRETLGEAVAWRAVSDAPTGLRLPHDGQIVAELMYAAGGNAAVLFRDQEAAVRVVRAWSTRLLRDAPGLRIAVAHQRVVAGRLGAAWGAARAALSENKAAPPPAPPLEGISLTRMCPSTGLAAAGWPAPETDEDRAGQGNEALRRAARLRSPVAASRLGAADRANARLFADFKPALPGRFAFTQDVEQLGQREGEQHLAVVHADGNGLGKRFAQALAGGDDDGVATAVQAFAASVHRAAQEALTAMLSALAGSYDDLVGRGLVPRASRVLPCRPILYGGDDVTFVCHGRLGLALAATYLERFAQRRDTNGLPFSACAGVAITHTRAPFSQAYRLADALCREAKKRARAQGEDGTSWLDAHLALEQPQEPILPARDRRRAGLVDRTTGMLDWRPWRVTPAKDDDRDWQDVAAMMRSFGDHTVWPSSVRHALLEALVAGPAASQAVISQHRSRGRALPALHRRGAPDDGWVTRLPIGTEPAGRATPYFDALELAGYFWEVRA